MAREPNPDGRGVGGGGRHAAGPDAPPPSDSGARGAMDRAGAAGRGGAAPSEAPPPALPDRPFYAAFERARMPMVVTDPGLPDNPIVFVNRAFLELTGYPEGEVLGRNCRFLQGPGTDPAAVAEIRAAVAAARDVAVELLNYRRDGSAFWNRLFLSPVRDPRGRVRHFFASQVDVTRRHEAEGARAALRASEARFRLLAEAGAGLLAAGDPDEALARLLRQLPEHTAVDLAFGHVADPGEAGAAAPAGLRLASVVGVPGEDAPRLAPLGAGGGACAEVAVTGRPVHAGDVQASADARLGPVRALGVRAYACEPLAAGGRPLGTLSFGSRRKDRFDADELAFFRAVAQHAALARERLRAEAALRRANEALGRRVAEAVAAREEALEQLAQSQRLEALGQLAGGVAHDFNNVLQAISGGARVILRRSADAAAVRRFAAMVLEAADRGASVTRRLLAFARREALRAEAVDAPALLRGLREVLAHTLGAAVEVRVEAPDGPAPLRADRSLLETVLVNLATNARDAMLPRGGVLTLSAAEEEVADALTHPAGLAPGCYVRLAVADTGAGMDAATLARAAEPFFTTKPRGKGTGLGLSMARGFAAQSGGGLRIESAPGRGTVVTLWLPRAEAAAAGGERGPAPVPARGPGGDAAGEQGPGGGGGGGEQGPGGGGGRLLLVDDDPLVRRALAAELRERGHEVAEAEGAGPALARLDAGEAVDLLVTDLSMPGMDGAALIYEAQGRRPGLPAVLVTGYAGEGAALAVGGVAPDATFALLRKPTSATELADLVAALLHGGAGGEASRAAGAPPAAARQGGPSPRGDGSRAEARAPDDPLRPAGGATAPDPG